MGRVLFILIVKNVIENQKFYFFSLNPSSSLFFSIDC